MKSVFISYNQAHHEDIIHLMDRNNIRGFTHWEEVHGRGSKTGDPHYGSHAWPTLNSAIIAIVEDSKTDLFLTHLRELDQDSEAQGLRAFVWNIEQMI